MMLEQSLRLIEGPGENRRGDRGEAPWTFGLSRRPATVLCLGERARDDALVRGLARAGAAVTTVGGPDEAAPADAPATFDLGVVVAPNAEDVAALRSRCTTVIAVDLPAGRVDRGTRWRLVSDGGVVRGLLDVGDDGVDGVDGVDESELVERIVAERPRRSVRSMARTRRRQRPTLERRELAVWGEPAVPSYLVALAAAHGVDLSAHRWALWCRGDYASQKLIVLLRRPGAPAADVVVKIARDARSNARLANEAAMLSALATQAPGAGERAPTVVFSGRHDGAFLCAEGVLAGRPFRQVARPGPATVALLADGAAWLTELASATARPVPGAAFGPPLRELVDRFAAAFEPPAAVRAALDAQVATMDELAVVPAVAVHGDPGVWNTLVDGGRLRFLDWESGEPDGLPLWDLLHFLRSGLLAADPSRRWRSRMVVLRRHLVGGSRLTPLVAGHLAKAQAALGLPDAALEPLVHLCWLHRAVKEASRLGPGEAHRSHYAALLRAGLEGRDEAGFRQLVGRMK